MTDKVQVGTRIERDITQRVVEVDCDVTLLGAFLRRACYWPIEWLVYVQIVSGCNGGRALLYVSL